MCLLASPTVRLSLSKGGIFFSHQIWDTDGQGGWRLTGSWKAHHGSVWKVTWAHPEFGQVIATCSFDRTAAIWEEVGEDIKITIHSIIIRLGYSMMTLFFLY